MNNERFPRRKSPRIPTFDYSSPNYYFITICTDQKKRLFGEPEKLNAYGIIAKNGFDNISAHYSQVAVDKCVVMPNHVHAILVLSGTEVNLSVVIGSYKAYVSRMIHVNGPKIKVWQRSFHDHVIRNWKSYEEIWTYIDSNPYKWKDDCFFEPETDRA